jgi:hypothetical protein
MLHQIKRRWPTVIDTLSSVHNQAYAQARLSVQMKIDLATSAGPSSDSQLGSVSEINIPQLDTLLNCLLALQPGVQLSASSRHRQEPQGLSFRLCVHVMLVSTSAKVTMSDRIFVHSGMPTKSPIVFWLSAPLAMLFRSVLFYQLSTLPMRVISEYRCALSPARYHLVKISQTPGLSKRQPDSKFSISAYGYRLCEYGGFPSL